MGRERMVTRGIDVLVCRTICMNIETMSTETVDLELTSCNLRDDKLMSALRKEYETDTYKLVSIVSTAERTDMYGMREVDFIKLAKKLDPTTRKALIDNADN